MNNNSGKELNIDSLVIGCSFCSEYFDNCEKLEKHEDDHKRMGDITVKAIVQSIRNEYNKVIIEAKNCKSCQQYEYIMCEHHTKLVKMLKEALHE